MHSCCATEKAGNYGIIQRDFCLYGLLNKGIGAGVDRIRSSVLPTLWTRTCIPAVLVIAWFRQMKKGIYSIRHVKKEQAVVTRKVDDGF